MFFKSKSKKNTGKKPERHIRPSHAAQQSTKAQSFSEQQRQQALDPKRAHLAQRRGQPAAPITARSRKRFSLVKFIIICLSVLVFLITSWLLYYFYGPRWGSIHYGICKIFAERYVEFPLTMNIRDVEYFQYTVRVFVTHIDASGQYRYDQFICEFNPTGELQLANVRLNRKNVEEQVIKEFNLGIDAIILNPPSLIVPRRLEELTIGELWHGGY